METAGLGDSPHGQPGLRSHTHLSQTRLTPQEGTHGESQHLGTVPGGVRTADLGSTEEHNHISPALASHPSSPTHPAPGGSRALRHPLCAEKALPRFPPACHTGTKQP